MKLPDKFGLNFDADTHKQYLSSIPSLNIGKPFLSIGRSSKLSAMWHISKRSLLQAAVVSLYGIPPAEEDFNSCFDWVGSEVATTSNEANVNAPENQKKLYSVMLSPVSSKSQVGWCGCRKRVPSRKPYQQDILMTIALQEQIMHEQTAHIVHFTCTYSDALLLFLIVVLQCLRSSKE